jgi:heat-inducible transcriptional repressor
VLFALCRVYIASGRPVASAVLTQHLECSSATIRSELAALEEHGLLHQPHHSAGRVPTAAGMRLYVQALGALPPPSPGVCRAVDVSLRDLVHGPEGMRVATRC